MKPRILVIGDGGWGTALATVLHRNGHPVRVWGRDPENVRACSGSNENARYLAGVTLPPGIEWTADAAEACDGIAGAVLATPSAFFRDVAREFAAVAPASLPLVSVAKGLDPDTRERMTEVAEAEFGWPAAVLSGPSHAEEVALGTPAAVTIAAPDEALAAFWQSAFTQPVFRVYRSDDVVGVELGGVLKNVVAIAAGIGDGIGYGDNPKAALLTRGLAEMTRIGVALGARKDTFAGLAGMGDLIVTCTSAHSRNRGLGERIGRGETVDEILASTQKVAEGYWNAATARQVAAEHRVPAPIVEEVHQVLYEGKDPRRAVEDLLTREVGREE